MIDINTMQSFSGMTLKQIMMHPVVFAAWSTTVLAMIIAFGKSLPLQVFNRIKHYLTIVLTIDESDNISGFDIFDSYNKWVINNRIEWLSRSFEVDFTKKIQSGQGFQVVWYKKALFFITMNRREPKGQNAFKTIGYYTIVTAKWNKNKLDEMIKESCSYKDKGQIQIVEYRDVYATFDYPEYIYDQKQLISKKVYQRISDTFERFNNDPGYYTSRKIPYKETIMLYGPPGTGKTSLIRHLAAKHNMNLILTETNNLNPLLVSNLSKKSKQSGIKNVILLEDISSNHSLLKKDSNSSLSDSESEYMNSNLSKFLNTLDGANPLDDVIIVMTTNHIEKLDSAIYRQGRVDHNICMEYMSFDEANDYILNWDKNDPRIEYIKNNLIIDKLSANTIMKLKSMDENNENLIDRRFMTVIEDNNNFMDLFDDIELKEEV